MKWRKTSCRTSNVMPKGYSGIERCEFPPPRSTVVHLYSSCCLSSSPIIRNIDFTFLELEWSVWSGTGDDRTQRPRSGPMV